MTKKIKDIEDAVFANIESIKNNSKAIEKLSKGINANKEQIKELKEQVKELTEMQAQVLARIDKLFEEKYENLDKRVRALEIKLEN